MSSFDSAASDLGASRASGAGRDKAFGSSNSYSGLTGDATLDDFNADMDADFSSTASGQSAGMGYGGNDSFGNDLVSESLGYMTGGVNGWRDAYNANLGLGAWSQEAKRAEAIADIDKNLTLSMGNFKELERTLGLDVIGEDISGMLGNEDDRMQSGLIDPGELVDEAYQTYDPATNTTVTYDPVTKTHIGYRDATFLGIKLGYEEDFHFNDFGEELGMVDELAADMLEAFGVNVNTETAAAIQSTTSVLMSVAFQGIPAGVIGRVTLAAQTVTAIADISLANGLISREERNTLRAVSSTIALMGAGISAIQSIQTISAIRSAGVINSAQAVVLGALTVIDLGTKFDDFTNALDRLGVTSTPTAADAESFAYSKEGRDTANVFDESGGVKKVYQKFAQWMKAKEGQQQAAVEFVENDPYSYMAGGLRYDITKAGSALYSPANRDVPDACVTFRLSVSPSAKQSILQENGIYKDLKPIKTPSKYDSKISAIGIARRAQFNALVDERNGLVADYNAKVDEYNNNVSILTDDIADLGTRIDTYQTQSEHWYNQILQSVTGNANYMNDPFGTTAANIQTSYEELEQRKEDMETAKIALETTLDELMASIESIESEIEEFLS